MKHRIKRFWNNIKRIFFYIPIIWRTKDWDYNYAIDLFEIQLKRLQEHLDSNKAYHLNAKIDTQKINTFLKLLKKVRDSEYQLEYFDQIEEIYGKDIMKFEFIPTDETKEFYRIKHKYEDLPNKDEIESKLEELRFKSHKKQEKAEKLIYKYLEQYLQTWWD